MKAISRIAPGIPIQLGSSIAHPLWIPARRCSVQTPHRVGDASPYSTFPIATAVSAMRLEKPHSLSYHDITRTRLPFITLFWSMCRVDECGSWLKSIETLGEVV